MKETLEEIGQLTALEADWNDEEAPAIDRAAILRAQKMVQWLACNATEQKMQGDYAPSVFPTIDGGVRLYWNASGRQVALTFHPATDTIDVMEKKTGETAAHWALSEEEAVAVQAMRDAV